MCISYYLQDIGSASKSASASKNGSNKGIKSRKSMNKHADLYLKKKFKKKFWLSYEKVFKKYRLWKTPKKYKIIQKKYPHAKNM